MQDLVTLVRLASGGDRNASGALYDRFARLVRAICYEATDDLTEAEDLAQEVFLRAFSKMEQLHDADRFPAWLLGIARNLAADWRRRALRRPNYQTLHEAVPAKPNREGERCEETAQLLRAINRLPESERLAMHLYYLDEQPIELARAALGLSRSGFYKLLKRARSRLRSRLVPCEELRR